MLVTALGHGGVVGLVPDQRSHAQEPLFSAFFGCSLSNSPKSRHSLEGNDAASARADLALYAPHQTFAQVENAR